MFLATSHSFSKSRVHHAIIRRRSLCRNCLDLLFCPSVGSGQRKAMNWKALLLIVLLPLLLLESCAATASDQSVKNIEVCFSPRGGCTAAVVREPDATKETGEVVFCGSASDEGEREAGSSAHSETLDRETGGPDNPHGRWNGGGQ
jgi:hypothetical protein